MNPLIKKQFILEAYSYNASLEQPLHISYVSSSSNYTYTKTLYFKPFEPNQIQMIEKKYFDYVEKDIKAQMTEPHAGNLSFSPNISFLVPYFKHFFIQHKDLQLDLLKFYNEIVPYNFKSVDFLKDFEKKDIEPFLINIGHWKKYSTESLTDLHTFMLEKSFSEGFRVSILKKHVESNLKNINKHPHLSQGLEDFLFENYPQFIQLIAPNVVAIQNRFEVVDQEKYEMAFTSHKKTVYCLTDTIELDTLLKTFQIPGWVLFQYEIAINLYHEHIKEKLDLTIESTTSTNRKQIEIYIKMKTPDYSLIDYKKKLFILMDFYRNNSKHKVTTENISNLFFNQHLNDSLVPDNKKQKANKI